MRTTESAIGGCLQRLVRHWRFLPKITYTNWNKQPNVPKGLWKDWLQIKRFWGGRIIYIPVRHHQLELDFRRNWIRDMTENVPNRKVSHDAPPNAFDFANAPAGASLAAPPDSAVEVPALDARMGNHRPNSGLVDSRM